MRRLLFAVLAVAVLFIGCDKEDEVLFMNEFGFGTLVSSGQIKTDGGLKYNITKNESGTDLVAGKRVIYICDLLKRISDEEYNVSVKQISYPLAKHTVTPGEAIGEEFKEDNPVNVDLAWFAGGYLNLRLYLFISSDADKRKTHYLNLVVDKENKTLTLRHYGEGEFYGEGGMELEDLVLAQTYVCFEADEFDADYTLHWKWHATDEDGEVVSPATGDCSYKLK